MSLQARSSQWDHRLYNINRDVAHNLGDVMREVADRLETGRWEALDRIMKANHVTPEQLGEACRAFCVFVSSATDDKREKMDQALLRSGWNSVPEPAQIAVMAILGSVMSGYYWVGAREARFMAGEGNGTDACLSLADLRFRGSLCSKLMMMTRWQRRWRRIKARLLKTMDALRGRKTASWRLAEIEEKQRQAAEGQP